MWFNLVSEVSEIPAEAYRPQKFWKESRISLNFAPETEFKKGTKAFPSSFIQGMIIEDQIQALEQRVNDLIVDEPDVFLVEVKIKPTNNVKVFLDADHGMNIDSLIRYNRKLYRVLEESSLFPGGDFSLEVSSPGLDEPLKLLRQYHKNTGRFVEVTGTDGMKREGKLIAVTEQEIVLEEGKGKGKKAELVQHIIRFSEIKTTRVQIKF